MYDPTNAPFFIPRRQTALDRSNTFAGKTQIFWNVDQIKTRNGTAYFMYTKIGQYTQNPPEQVNPFRLSCTDSVCRGVCVRDTNILCISS